MGTSVLEFFQPRLGELAAVAMAICATFSVVAWTSTGRRIGVLSVCCLRMAAATILLTFYELFMRGQWLPFDVAPHAWMLLAASGVLGYFLCDLMTIKAFVVIGPRLTLLLQSSLPLMVVFLEYFFFGEILSGFSVLGMIVTLSGVVWVVLERPESPKEAPTRKDYALGIAMTLGAAVLGAVALILAKKGVAGVDPFAATQIRILASLLCYPFLVTFLGRWGHIGKALRNVDAMKLLLFGTVLGPFLGMGLMMYALKVCPSAGIVTTIANLVPVLILPICILYYKEKVSSRAALGAIVSVAGIALIMYKPDAPELRSQSVRSPSTATAIAAMPVRRVDAPLGDNPQENHAEGQIANLLKTAPTWQIGNRPHEDSILGANKPFAALDDGAYNSLSCPFETTRFWHGSLPGVSLRDWFPARRPRKIDLTWP